MAARASTVGLVRARVRAVAAAVVGRGFGFVLRDERAIGADLERALVARGGLVDVGPRDRPAIAYGRIGGDELAWRLGGFGGADAHERGLRVPGFGGGLREAEVRLGGHLGRVRVLELGLRHATCKARPEEEENRCERHEPALHETPTPSEGS
jgi:hypothetical protein